MELQQQLLAAGIDLASWGTGPAKTLAHLQKEVDDGEAVIVTKPDGRLVRCVEVCDANVFGISPDGRHLRLKEDRQVFADGRERRRQLQYAVLEKMHAGERPLDAMVRGIREELGVAGDIDITAVRVDLEEAVSPSYPGLLSRYSCHVFDVMLCGEQVRPDGYVEVQADKRTFFIWEPVE